MLMDEIEVSREVPETYSPRNEKLKGSMNYFVPFLGARVSRQMPCAEFQEDKDAENIFALGVRPSLSHVAEMAQPLCMHLMMC